MDINQQLQPSIQTDNYRNDTTTNLEFTIERRGTGVDWYVAHVLCEDMGGVMVTIMDMSHNDKLLARMREKWVLL